MTVTILVGGFYGDEGKGKIISYISQNDKPKIVARAGVGTNAGHSVYLDGKKYGIRQIPTGFVNPSSRLLVGAGVLVDPEVALKEIAECGVEDRIGIDERCTLILPEHRERESKSEHLVKKVGSTKSGCGEAMVDRVRRIAKIAREDERLASYITDVSKEINDAIDEGESVLIEGTQGSMLSLLYGSYPFSTSKDTNAATFCADVGIGPTLVDDVIVIYKAYISRVGEGELPTQLTEENIDTQPFWKKFYENLPGKKEASLNETIADAFGERGTVTGRVRRIGSFDYELAKKTLRINGTKKMAITCLDKLFPETAGLTEYEKLSSGAKAYLREIEEKTGGKVVLVSTGPNPEDTVDLR